MYIVNDHRLAEGCHFKEEEWRRRKEKEKNGQKKNKIFSFSFFFFFPFFLLLFIQFSPTLSTLRRDPRGWSWVPSAQRESIRGACRTRGCAAGRGPPWTRSFAEKSTQPVPETRDSLCRPRGSRSVRSSLASQKETKGSKRNEWRVSNCGNTTQHNTTQQNKPQSEGT